MIKDFYSQKKENNNKTERKQKWKENKNFSPSSLFQAVQNKIVFKKLTIFWKTVDNKFWTSVYKQKTDIVKIVLIFCVVVVNLQILFSF